MGCQTVFGGATAGHGSSPEAPLLDATPFVIKSSNVKSGETYGAAIFKAGDVTRVMPFLAQKSTITGPIFLHITSSGPELYGSGSACVQWIARDAEAFKVAVDACHKTPCTKASYNEMTVRSGGTKQVELLSYQFSDPAVVQKFIEFLMHFKGPEAPEYQSIAEQMAARKDSPDLGSPSWDDPFSSNDFA